MSRANSNRAAALGRLAFKNMKRWWGRLAVIAVLVLLTSTLNVLYHSMLISQQTKSTAETERLELPYDLLVKLPENMQPIDLEELPKPLNSKLMVKTTYNWEQNRWKELTYEVPSVPTAFSYAETAAGGLADTAYNRWDILGVRQDTAIFRFAADELQGTWLSQTGDLLIPYQDAAEYRLAVGDTVVMRVINPSGSQRTTEFHICGIFDTGDDLAQPLILFEDAIRLFSLSTPNRQLLLCNELLTHATGLEENMQQVYPGAVFLYEWIAQNRTQQLTTEMQAPSAWILLLIYLFMGFGVLTLSLITFLERRKELAILKSIGFSNLHIVILLVMEYGCATAVGLLGSLFVLRALIPRFSWYQSVPSGTLERLSIQNLVITALVLTISLLYPILLAKLASVNQLIYKRKIPLIVERFDHLVKPTPQQLLLERDRNVRVLQLEIEEGKVFGSFLRQPGEHIKQGEVLLIQESFSGFVYKEWIAPCNGILEFDPFSGILIIVPDDPNYPKHAYPAEILATYDRRGAAFQNGQNENTER